MVDYLTTEYVSEHITWNIYVTWKRIICFLWSTFIGHHSLLEEVGIHSEEIYFFSSPDAYFIFYDFSIATD